MTKLFNQLEEASRAFAVCSQPPALIGGMAVNVHHVVRTTTDLDFLVAARDSDPLHEALTGLGYRSLYRTENVANYCRGSERLDLIYAHQPRALRLLAEAQCYQFGSVGVPVVGVEDLIGFKLQALKNAPHRAMDEQDIRELLRANFAGIDMEQLKDYFALFDKQPWLEELIEELRIAEDLE